MPGAQMVVEKMLATEGVSRLDLGREAFEERVWQWKQQYGDFITSQMRRMGASCDWSRERFTLDAQLSGEPNTRPCSHSVAPVPHGGISWAHYLALRLTDFPFAHVQLQSGWRL
jgi:hypothetical protein